MAMSSQCQSSVQMESGPRAKDHRILSLMLARLNSLGLITNDEKLKLGRMKQPSEAKIAIFDMLLEKPLVSASKMFVAIRSMKLENDGSQSLLEMMNNPMQTYTVIKAVLDFLDLPEVKNCRLINKRWNSVAGPLLGKRSTVSVGSGVDINTKEINSSAKFLETYAASSIKHSFDCFQLENGFDWNVSDLKIFFAQQKKKLKELALHGVKLIDENGLPLTNYDINDWLVGSPLRKLEIDCCKSTVLTLNLDNLHSVRDINLANCVVNVKVPTRCLLSPVIFHVGDVTWQLENGSRIEEFFLNNFIDFHKTKVIKMDHGPKVIFDISKCLHLRKLILRNKCTIVNWSRAKTTVNFMVMEGIPFLDKTEMKINGLIFEDSSIDLFALPWAIEKLYLGGGTTVSCSQPITLPNLKEISCGIQAELLTTFANCANLVDIYFNGSENEELNVNWIPKSVKRIKMEKVKIVGGILNLETLVTGGSLSDAVQMLKSVKPKVMVLCWQKNFETNDSVLEFLKQFKDMILYMGPFFWDEDLYKFETSKLANYVDKKAQHYVFKNNRGKSIDDNDNGFLSMYLFHQFRSHTLY